MDDLSKYIDYIIENNKITISEFKKYFNLTDSTARRKLKKIESLGYVKLNYGGIVEVVNEDKISILDDYKKGINSKEKKELSLLAASKIEDEDIIFIDNGTTVRYILKYLKTKNNIIYTNGFNHINFVRKNGLDLDLRLIPGKIRFKEGAIVGEEALMFMGNLYVDKVFIGANGFDEKFGITTPNEDEKNLKRLALELGMKSYVLVDKNKKGIKSKFKVCNLEDYEIISN